MGRNEKNVCSFLGNVRDFGSSGPGSSPGKGYCVLFLGKTLYSHRTAVPLSTQNYNWGNCWSNLTVCRRATCDGLTSHPEGVPIYTETRVKGQLGLGDYFFYYGEECRLHAGRQTTIVVLNMSLFFYSFQSLMRSCILTLRA